MMFKEHGLLFHYNLALQTLTPLALKLSNRKNMRSNQLRADRQGDGRAGRARSRPS